MSQANTMPNAIHAVAAAMRRFLRLTDFIIVLSPCDSQGRESS